MRTLKPTLALLATLFSAAPTFAQTAAAPDAQAPWWKHAVIYEIYPRSFQDTNGDGMGDLNGITKHLDYLQWLGVDAIWIAPMYPSPQVDFGYDISNYVSVDSQYGTLADFDRLEASAKQHHIRIILDFVLNHTSDKHAWFLESASSRTNPKADWFIWNDGKPGTGPNAHVGPHGSVVPPNNWTALFGGSAWEWNATRGQFYYHRFYKQQPDLNWRNPAVEKAMFDVLRFWFDRGVAGFRLDAVPELFEDPQLRDETPTGGTNAQGDLNLTDHYINNLPEVHDVMRRMRALADSYPERRVLIGETYLKNVAALDEWYGGTKHDQLQLPMNMFLGFNGGHATGTDLIAASRVRGILDDALTQLHGSQPLFVFDNHDRPRSWDRIGDGAHNPQIARAVSAMLYTIPATALTYYGAELGMHTETPTRVEDVRDPIGITGWPKEKGRDGERTPMQWDTTAQSGFSTNRQTWLPIERDYPTINVATERADASSLLNWNRTLIAIRRDNPVMRSGVLSWLDKDNPSVLSYARVLPGNAHPLIVAINTTAQPQTIHLDLNEASITGTRIKTLLADDASLSSLTSLNSVTLPPFTSLIAEVQ